MFRSVRRRIQLAQGSGKGLLPVQHCCPVRCAYVPLKRPRHFLWNRGFYGHNIPEDTHVARYEGEVRGLDQERREEKQYLVLREKVKCGPTSLMEYRPEVFCCGHHLRFCRDRRKFPPEIFVGTDGNS